MASSLTTRRHPKVVHEINEAQDANGVTTRKLSLNGDALPGQGQDDLLLLLAQQVLDATKIDTSTAKDAETRYNATMAALHDIAPMGAVEGMIAAQLIAAHMAVMDCYKHLNKTNDRNTHAYHLNQVNKLSRTYVALLEALNRHRGKGQQKVTVEHVHVHHGGQAIVGNIESPGVGVKSKTNGSTTCVNG